MAAEASALQLPEVFVPPNYTCRITGQIMADPVVADDGYTYEREAIEKWLKTYDTSPKTGERLQDKRLKPNRDKRSDILGFLEKYPDLYELDQIYLPTAWIRQLVTAIKANEIKEVQEGLAKDKRLLTARLEGDYTAFHLACQFGSAELANVLLESLTKRGAFDKILKQPPAGFKPVYLNVVLQLQEQGSRIKQLEVELAKEKKIVKDQDGQIQQQASRIKQFEVELAKEKGVVKEQTRRIEQLEKELKRKSEVSSSGPAIIPQYQVQAKPSPKVEVKIKAEEIQKFLNYVVAGAQPEAEAMLKANQDLALSAGTVTDHAKRTFKNITGFQYAVWALDWQMWRMIKSYLPKEAAQEQAKDFSQGSWVKEHGECVSWKRLTEAQQTLIDNYDKWDWKKIDEFWVQQIGGAQLLLPIHVLQEYSQPGRPFEPIPDFNGEYILARGEPGFLAGLGQRVGIIRGRLNDTERSEDIIGKWGDAEYIIRGDRLAVVQLYDTRTEQRRQLLVELAKDRNHAPSK